jgi:hypothetical protein
MDDLDPELATFLSAHSAHGDLVKWGFVSEVGMGLHQVNDPPAIIRAIKERKLTGEHATLAADLVLKCKPPKGFWYAETAAQLIEHIIEDQPL